MSREHRNALLNELLPMARELLEKNGEFYPFAGAIAPNGETKLIAGTTTGDRPQSTAILEVLAAGLAEGVRAGQYSVTGICFPIGTGADDASEICIEFEDADSEPSAVRVPYTKKHRFVDFGEMTLVRCESRVFDRS